MQAELSDYNPSEGSNAGEMLGARQHAAFAMFARIERRYGVDLADATMDQVVRLVSASEGEVQAGSVDMLCELLPQYLRHKWATPT